MRFWERKSRGNFIARKGQAPPCHLVTLSSSLPVTIPQAFELALQRHREGRLADAEALYRQILAAQPNHADALHHLGLVAHQLGRNEFALAWISQAIVLQPDKPAAHSNLGNALAALGRLDEAIAAFRRATELKRDYAEAHFNLGNALRGRDRLDEAVAAYRGAVEAKPDYAEAHNNLGATLARQGHLDEAVSALRRALELRPNYAEALSKLGDTLKDRGELDEAIAAFRHALRIRPDQPRMHSNLVFTLHFHPGHDARSISEEHERWNRQFGDPAKQFLQPHANDRSPERRLRIGYVSPDFRDHPVGRFVLPLFERHDRKKFEILCYSGVLKPDWMTERLRPLAGNWRSTVGVSDARLAEMIREDGVDILVDLALHTGRNRLPVFARQPAPVQVTWLGYPGSTGLDSIGYRLTDAAMDPPGTRSCGTEWSAEEPDRLPGCWCCYDPIGDTPDINALPALSAERVTFGSLNSFAKVNEGVLALWTRVLEAVKESRLLMLCPPGQTRERVQAFFETRGIAPERVAFVGLAPRWEYLKTYHRIDLALDPFPCNGMTTTCDALWMGVPVLTLPGAMPHSRAGLSLLSTVGLGELAASSEQDHIRIAESLANDLPRLAQLRLTLRDRMKNSPLMDAPRFARNIEAAYRSMWERWQG